MNHLRRIALFAVLALFLAVLIAWAGAWMDKPGKVRDNDLNPVSAEAFGGPFTLTDHTGKTVTDKDFAGAYRLIYFGFTFCPAICPTELQKISTALDILGEEAKDVQPLFITVDPGRDTVEVMKNYISLFHPRLIGLTGTQAQIDSVLKAYKVYAARVQDETMTDYTMDHSSFIYFLDPENRLLRIYKTDDTAAYIARDMADWLESANPPEAHSVSSPAP